MWKELNKKLVRCLQGMVGMKGIPLRDKLLAISSRIFCRDFRKRKVENVRLEKAKIDRVFLKCKCFHLKKFFLMKSVSPGNQHTKQKGAPPGAMCL